MLLLIINLSAGATAATIYGLWAARWWHRKARLLALLNALVAIAAIVFTVGYAILLTRAAPHADVALFGFRPALSLVLVLPAVARLLELRRDERREAVARRLATDLHMGSNRGE